MAKFVCNGALLKCSMGDLPSTFTVFHPPGLVNLEKKPMANIMDFKPLVNIMTFGMCKCPANPVVASATTAALGVLTPMPCVPNTTMPWTMPKPNVFVKKMPAITDQSQLMCLWTGIIKVNFAGQVSTNGK